MGTLLAFLALLVLAPLVAIVARRYGRNLKGGLAILLLGVGHVVDPPAERMIEANERKPKGPKAPGEPKDLDPDAERRTGRGERDS